jgi:hypothetical protein
MFLFDINKLTLDPDGTVIYCEEDIGIFNVATVDGTVIFCDENISVFNI